jgi:signal transduction histidine kinase
MKFLMRNVFVVLQAVLCSCFAFGQNDYADSLLTEVNNAKEDTTKVLALSALADHYGFNQFDSSIFYARKIIDLSEKINYPYGGFLGRRSLFFAYNCQGNYLNALEASLQNFKLTEGMRKERPHAWGSVHYFLGVLNREMENFQAAIPYLNQAIKIKLESEPSTGDVFPDYSQLALVYQRLKKPDSALWFAEKGYELSLKSKRYIRFASLAALVLGNMYNEAGRFELAKKYFSTGVQQSKMYKNTYFLARSYNLLASLFYKLRDPDSCIYYARISLQLCQEHNFSEYALDASSVLTKAFESQNKKDSSYKYTRIVLTLKDSVFSPSKMHRFQQFVFNEEQRQQKILDEQKQYKNRIKTYALLSGMIVLLLIAFILWRTNKQKQKAHNQIEKAYKDLKSTQAQLIQQEKMASLGELTAGIAHEIQNPLNFVNNFSEVSNELLDEMKSELTKDNKDDVMAIAADIKQNLEKIVYHGKRADGIVKGMLQHSRSSSGVKESTDINKLADEYLRLAYHGLKAKNKSFNAKFETDFDSSIGKINVVAQDIGRVILNLVNNAFYAVNERSKQGVAGYEPTVIAGTRRLKGRIEISVKDNGYGIPDSIKEKIFQPFFTTKPTGEGTGLGLSLAYDIVKAHGGEIKVQSKQGEGTEFIVDLPI